MALTSPDPIEPAQLAFLADGTLYSPRHDDVYASAAGAISETRHVFLGGNRLPERWRDAERFVIVETGFGAALNFLVTWSAWRETAQRNARLHFISVEKYPFHHADLAQVLAAHPEFGNLARELLERYPPAVPGFHRLRLDGGRVRLTLLFGTCCSRCASSMLARTRSIWTASRRQKIRRCGATRCFASCLD